MVLFKRVLTVSLLALLTIPLVPAVQARDLSPTVQPLIGGCAAGGSTFVQKYVQKRDVDVPIDHFEGVRGDTTIVSQLDACIGTGGGGTFIDFANMQTNVADHIVQLAYGKINAGDSYHFYWTPNGVSAGSQWAGTLVPIAGHRIRGTITKDFDRGGNVVAHYTLFDITANITESMNGTYPTGDMNVAWWGEERLDNSAQMGATENFGSYPSTQLAYMGYRPNATTAWTFRSGLVAADIKTTGSVQSCEHAYIGTWVYTHDMLNLSNTCF